MGREARGLGFMWSCYTLQRRMTKLGKHKKIVIFFTQKIVTILLKCIYEGIFIYIYAE